MNNSKDLLNKIYVSYNKLIDAGIAYNKETHQNYARANMQYMVSLLQTAEENKEFGNVLEYESVEDDEEDEDNFEGATYNCKYIEDGSNGTPITDRLRAEVITFRRKFNETKSLTEIQDLYKKTVNLVFNLIPTHNDLKYIWYHPKGSPIVTVSSMLTLRPAQWISSDVINAYLWLLNKDCPKISILPSFWWTKICIDDLEQSYNYSAIARWTKPSVKYNRKSIFKYDKVLIPMNTMGKKHWSIVIIDFESKNMVLRESMINTNFARVFFRIIKLFLWHEYKNKLHCNKERYNLNLQEWGAVVPPEYAQQKNGVDCGVYLLKSAKQLVQRQRVIERGDAFKPDEFRSQILCDLLHGKIQIQYE